MTVDSSNTQHLTEIDLGDVTVINSTACDGDELECHLAVALDHTTDSTARFHLRQALQLLTIERDETTAL